MQRVEQIKMLLDTMNHLRHKLQRPLAFTEQLEIFETLLQLQSSVEHEIRELLVSLEKDQVA